MNKYGSNDESNVQKDLPENIGEYAGVVSAVRSWVREGDAIPVTDMARLRTEVLAQNPGRRARLHSLWSGTGWIVAAASLCVLAMSLGEFQFQWGSFNFQLGSGVPVQELELLRKQLADIQQRSELRRSEYSAAIEALSNRTTVLENDLHMTAVKLIRAQEAESATRYNEISSILSMTSRIE